MKKTSICSVIAGTGSYFPTRKILNSYFLEREFFTRDGARYAKSNQEIICRFESITGIKERRYITDDLSTSDIAFFSAQEALRSSGLEKESLDYIIVAHNFGDLRCTNRRTDIVPSISARVKYKLGIENPKTIAYDLPFGCPGWLQGVIQADCYIKAGIARRVMVIGAETLSRISDPHDVDSMIYSDGAGAVIFQAKESADQVGLLSHAARTDTLHHAHLIHMGPSYNPGFAQDELFLKMDGHKVYEYALRTVPALVKECLDAAGLSISDISKVLLHQANFKMDEAIFMRLCKMYGVKAAPHEIMPMTIEQLGNSSVATLPTLIDLLLNEKLDGHTVAGGNLLVFASVGAGMSINTMLYKVPNGT
jgi:3-oxoacyl-[acyl-carrier-protein] synthase-3